MKARIYLVHNLKLTASIVYSLASVLPCLAEETAPKAQHFEAYSGLAYEGVGFASYSSAVWSPYADVSREGFRLRAGNLTSIYGDGAFQVFSGAFSPKSSLTVSDAELGYQFDYNWFWLKVYAGAALRTELKLWREVGAVRQEQGLGAKVSVETWSRLSDRAWLSTNASWVDIGKSANLYARAGYDLIKLEKGMTVAFGIEASLSRDEIQTFRRLKETSQVEDYASGGGFANLRYGVHDISLSAGLSQSDGAPNDFNPHITFTYGRKF